jgi:integrase
MARTIRDAALETRTARSRLKARGKPYWRGIDPGLHLGYRKGKTGGRWVARLYLGDEQYRVETLDGIADDAQDADGGAVLSYVQAQQKARELFKVRGEAAVARLTIATALDEYESDLEARNGDVNNVSRLRGHLPAEWLDRSVASLSAGELNRWRNGLRKTMAAASVNRVGNSFRAMLNLAADNHGLNERPWNTALASIPGATQSNNVILNEAMVRAIVAQSYVPTMKAAEQINDAAARRQAEEEAQRFANAFGLFVEVVSTTGARPVQVSRLTLGDLPEHGQPRLMMPSSKKGKGAKKITHRPVPISRDLMVRLREAAGDRPRKAPLLVKPSGKAWAKSDHARPFARAAKAAGADPDEVTIYALRHSSIVRQIKANVPLRIVAASHDTSAAMIERHYSEHITDHADEMTRAALLDFGTPAKSNVVEMPTR